MLTTRSTHRTTIVAALACALLAIAAPVAAAQSAGGGSSTLDSSALDTTATPPLPAPPTRPVNPEPIQSAPVVKTTDTSGLDWMTIALGFGGLLVLGGIAGVVLHSRRIARGHIAA